MAEDTVGKGEYVGYQHFLLFQQYLKEKKFRVFFFLGGGGGERGVVNSRPGAVKR